MGLLDFKTEPDETPATGGEADLQAGFNQWKANPGTAANARMLETMGPTIDRAARSQLGELNPMTRSKARIVALKALDSYDPAKGKLASHLYNHMQGLKRYAAQASAGIRVPERLALDRRTATSAHGELTAELGREPTDDELSDRTGMSGARIRRSRSAGNAMSSGFFSQMSEDGDAYDPAIRSEPHSDAWTAAIYDDLSPLDKKVFELSTGWQNNRILSGQMIARKLRRSPGWVSQRKLVIQKALDQAQDLNPF